jgi:hypothetical protein
MSTKPKVIIAYEVRLQGECLWPKKSTLLLDRRDYGIARAAARFHADKQGTTATLYRLEMGEDGKPISCMKIGEVKPSVRVVPEMARQNAQELLP